MQHGIIYTWTEGITPKPEKDKKMQNEITREEKEIINQMTTGQDASSFELETTDEFLMSMVKKGLLEGCITNEGKGIALVRLLKK